MREKCLARANLKKCGMMDGWIVQGWIDLIKRVFKSLLEEDLIIEELDKVKWSKGLDKGLNC